MILLVSDGRMYLVAFIALWLCGFVAIIGELYIHPSVIVIAYWIVMREALDLRQTKMLRQGQLDEHMAPSTNNDKTA